MVFNSTKELENYILSRSKIAVDNAKEKVFNVIKKFLDEFYNEFNPDVYIRTKQLLNSLVKTDVKKSGKGWYAEVYFDLSKLDYSTRIVPQGQPWSSWASSDNTYHRENWGKENDAWVLETAMTGDRPHGGYEEGTKIWDESMKVLSADKIQILKQALISAGIPVI